MVIMTGIGKPRSVPPPRKVYCVGSPKIVWPFEYAIVRPRPIERVASVVMKAERPRRVTLTPLNRPTPRPIARPTSRPIHHGQPLQTITPDERIPDKATTDPTERSMPAVIMTKVAPIAQTATIVLCSIILSQLLTVRNRSERMLKTITRSNKAIWTVNRLRTLSVC